jgi:chitinase
VSNQVKDASGNLVTVTDDVPGLCDDIVKLQPLITQFTFSQDGVSGRRLSVCPKSSCAPKSKELSAKLGTSLLLQCDEFPWGSSEQGGTYLPSNQRRTKCVPNFQNNWHGKCVREYS